MEYMNIAKSSTDKSNGQCDVSIISKSTLPSIGGSVSQKSEYLSKPTNYESTFRDVVKPSSNHKAPTNQSTERKLALELLGKGLKAIRRWPKLALRVDAYQVVSEEENNEPLEKDALKPIVSRRAKQIQIQIEKLERPPPTKTVHLREKRCHALRELIPRLDRMETTKLRTSFKNNMCLQLLRKGYHKSFCQIFNLIEYQYVSRIKAGPESIVWWKPMLINETNKLDFLYTYLSRAELAMLQGKFIEMYNSYFALAVYFQRSHEDDKWLSDYFFELTLEASSQIKSDGGRRHAEAHSNVGQSFKASELYDLAAKFLEKFYDLTSSSKAFKNWMTPNGLPLHTEACNQLRDVYTMIADKTCSHANKIHEHRFYLKKAYDMATESNELTTKGKASYVLGMAYDKNMEYEKAIECLYVYLDVCRQTDNQKGVAIAYQKLAVSYHSLGNTTKSIQYLKQSVKVSEDCKNDIELSTACCSLGLMCNNNGDYQLAARYFNKAYNISRAMSDEGTIIQSRVCYGIATGHLMLLKFMSHVESLAPKTGYANQKLHDWKDSRHDAIHNSTPTPAAPPRNSVIKMVDGAGKVKEPSLENSDNDSLPSSDNDGDQKAIRRKVFAMAKRNINNNKFNKTTDSKK